jgi:hypothetical protein
MLLDVTEPTAGEIVHHAHLRSALDQRVNEMRPDEGGPARYKNFPTIPDDVLPFFLGRLLR